MLVNTPYSGLGGSGNPAGSPPAPLKENQGLPGSVSAYGFHTLPRNGITQEVVRLLNGNVNRTIPIVTVSGPGPGLDFKLTHSTEDDFVGPLGVKWRHSYETKLVVNTSLVTLITGDGQHIDFISNGSGGWKIDATTSLFDTIELTNPSGTIWQVTAKPSEHTWSFDATEISGYPATAGRLLAITDRHGNSTTLTYASGRLSKLEDAQGREIQLAYDGNGRLEEITDPNGNLTLLTYTPLGQLRTMSGPEGCTVTFEYHLATGHIIAQTDARGHVTRYVYGGNSLHSITFSDGMTLGYSYLRKSQETRELIGKHEIVLMDTTRVCLNRTSTFEFRFEKKGNLWRFIAPSGHVKKYFWSSKQRFLYASEGYWTRDTSQTSPTDPIPAPIDNNRNRYTRRTVDENGLTTLTLDGTGQGSTVGYDEAGRVAWIHPGQVDHGIQGSWPGTYGSEGIILCAFNPGHTDAYDAPTWLDPDLNVAITNGDGLGAHQFVRHNVNGYNLVDPRTPVRGQNHPSKGLGFWKQTGDDVLGATFEFQINLPAEKKFNLSLYTHSADQSLQYTVPLRYLREYGRDVEIEVEDTAGVQTYRVHNNAPGVWVTFPVSGDDSNPITVRVRASGVGKRPVISAIAFDPYHDRRTFYEYTDGMLSKISNAMGYSSQYSYNLDGTLATMTDARDNVTTYEYLDIHKNLTKVISADLAETFMAYDDNGNVLTVTDANNHTSTMSYDGKNRMISLTDALGATTSIDYDGNGNVLSVTDPKNRVTRFWYDTMNRPIRVENSLGQSISMSYTPAGQLKDFQDARSLVTRYHYDEDGWLSSVEAPDGQSVSYSRDTLGQVVALTSPNGNQEAIELVNLLGAGNLFKNPDLEKADPNWSGAADHWQRSDGQRARSTSESLSGQASLELPATGQTWRQERLRLPEGGSFVALAQVKGADADFALGTLEMAVKVRDFEAASVRHSRSTELSSAFLDWSPTEALRFQVPGDSQNSQADPSLELFEIGISGTNGVKGWADDFRLHMLSTAYRYDRAGRLKVVTTPDGAQVTMIRDRFGRVVTMENPKGERTELVYDMLDRVVSLRKPSGEMLGFTYNQMGALEIFVDGQNHTTTFSYDSRNRLVGILYPDTSTEVFHYDAVGNLEHYSDNAGQHRCFDYDAADRLTTITYADSSIVSFDYDEVGNLTEVVERNGDVTEYSYDDLDRVTSVRRLPHSSNSTPAWRFIYEYDANGNRMSLDVTGSDYGTAVFGSDRYGVAESTTTLWQAYRGESRYHYGLYGQARYANQGFDSLDRPLGYQSIEGTRVTFGYDHEGRRDAVAFANGNSSRTSYDIMGRPLEMVTTDAALQELHSVRYSYDLTSSRTSQLTGNNTLDYEIDEDGRLVGEAINRLVLKREEFEVAELEKVVLEGDSLTLLPLADSFSPDQIDSDRWRVGYHSGFLAAAPTLDPDTFLGSKIWQENGLHFSFPRGYSNISDGALDIYQPLPDNFGATTTHGFSMFAEQRSLLEGDFDVQVDFENFQFLLPYTEKRFAALYVGANSREHIGLGNHALIGLFSNIFQTVINGGKKSGIITTATSGRLRIVRTGGSLTCYTWVGGSWVSQYDWNATSFSTAPLYVGLVVEIQTHPLPSACTFKNFQVNGLDYTLAGTATLPVYDAGREVEWHNLAWQETLPVGADAKLQVAVSNSPDGPWSYVGPDGTSGTYFTTSSGEALMSSTLGRYCRVKAFLSGTGSVTPTLSRIELSFSGETESQSRTYHYDLAGNLTHRTVRTDASLIEETRFYNAMNELVENVIDDGSTPVNWLLDYDDNGNLVSKTDGTDTWEYTWSDENHLLSVELNSTLVVEYVYDSSSRLLQRVEGGTTTSYHWDGWDLVREEKSGTVTETTDYLCPEGEVLAFKRDGDWYYLTGDALSSTQLVTDESGDVVGRYVYGAWGDELVSSESLPGLFENRFVGGLGCRRDSATGMVYMRHRWYSPELQRFISRDPIGFGGGSNFYKYAANNPINFVDTTGRYCEVTVDGNNVTITLPMEYQGPGATADVIARFNESIAKQWSGKFGRYNVRTTVVTPSSTTPADKKNTIQVPSGDGRATTAPFKNTGIWPGDRPGWTAAHESGHLMFLRDRYDWDTFVPEEGYEDNIMGAYGKCGVKESDIDTIIRMNK